MSCCGQKKENYGDVKLDWGVYPMGLEYDGGGCAGDEGAPLADSANAARAANAQRNIEQRGTNNAFQYEACPERLRYAVGTGCMNPMCKCPNCQGDCKCMRPGMMMMGRKHGLLFWVLVIVAIWLFYTQVYKKGLLRRFTR